MVLTATVFTKNSPQHPLTMDAPRGSIPTLTHSHWAYATVSLHFATAQEVATGYQ